MPGLRASAFFGRRKAERKAEIAEQKRKFKFRFFFLRSDAALFPPSAFYPCPITRLQFSPATASVPRS